MKTFRISILIILGAIVLPFAVVLRSYGAGVDPVSACEESRNITVAVAGARDRGMDILEAIEKANLLRMEGAFPLDQYPLLIAIIHDVYANLDKTPEELGGEVYKLCLKAKGITQAKK